MLLLGDCNDHLKDIKDNSIDLIVTDPPYGIEFMGKDWDKALVPTETWKECYRVLKEGKLAFVMCSPRQDVLSRMIVNLQDAGFRTNYTSIYWTFASGFPKAANISKLIDKKAGATREIIGVNEEWKRKFSSEVTRDSDSKRRHHKLIAPEGDITKPATEEAKKMEGAYVGFQPKPAVEVILVVSKGKTLTWLDDCRIPYQSEDDKEQLRKDTARVEGISMLPPEKGWNKNKMVRQAYNIEEKGRFPANLLVSDDVLNDGKNHKVGTIEPHHIIDSEKSRGIYGKFKHNTPAVLKKSYGDEGSYSRYFSLDAWAKTFPFLIVPKASMSERNDGLDSIQPVKVNDGRNTPIDNPFQRGETLRTNSHPTVKPLKLMSYLITMGSREGDLVLDPFCGSGTVCIAAHQLHRKWLGIEMNPEYAEIIKKRLADPLAQLKLTVFD